MLSKINIKWYYHFIPVVTILFVNYNYILLYVFVGPLIDGINRHGKIFIPWTLLLLELLAFLLIVMKGGLILSINFWIEFVNSWYSGQSINGFLLIYILFSLIVWILFLPLVSSSKEFVVKWTDEIFFLFPCLIIVDRIWDGGSLTQSVFIVFCLGALIMILNALKKVFSKTAEVNASESIDVKTRLEGEPAPPKTRHFGVDLIEKAKSEVPREVETVIDRMVNSESEVKSENYGEESLLLDVSERFRDIREATEVEFIEKVASEVGGAELNYNLFDDVSGIDQTSLDMAADLEMAYGDIPDLNDDFDVGSSLSEERYHEIFRVSTVYDGIVHGADDYKASINSFAGILYEVKPKSTEILSVSGLSSSLVDLVVSLLFEEMAYSVSEIAEILEKHFSKIFHKDEVVMPVLEANENDLDLSLHQKDDLVKIFKIAVCDKLPFGEFTSSDRGLYDRICHDEELFRLALKGVAQFDFSEQMYFTAKTRLSSVLGVDWKSFILDKRAIRVFLSSVYSISQPDNEFYERFIELDIDCMALNSKLIVLVDYVFIKERIDRLKAEINQGINDADLYESLIADQNGLEFVFEVMAPYSDELARLSEDYKDSLSQAQRRFGALVDARVVEIDGGGFNDTEAYNRGFAHILSLGMPVDEREQVSSFIDIAGMISSLEERISRECVIMQIERRDHNLYDALMCLKQDALRKAIYIQDHVRMSGAGETKLKVLLSGGGTDAFLLFERICAGSYEIRDYTSGAKRRDEELAVSLKENVDLNGRLIDLNKKINELESQSVSLSEEDSLKYFYDKLELIFTPGSAQHVHSISDGVSQVSRLSKGPAGLKFQSKLGSYAFILVHGLGANDWKIHDGTQFISERSGIRINLFDLMSLLKLSGDFDGENVFIRIIVVHGGVQTGLDGAFMMSEVLDDPRILLGKSGFDDVVMNP